MDTYLHCWLARLQRAVVLSRVPFLVVPSSLVVPVVINHSWS